MPRDDWEETTGIRMIRLEAKQAVAEERVGLIGAIRQMSDDIKEEMREHFASKKELADWKYDLYKEHENKTNSLINQHVARDHKPSITPGGRISLIPKARFTRNQKAGIITGVLGLLTGIGYAIKAWLEN
jgi:hypothetical protein